MIGKTHRRFELVEHEARLLPAADLTYDEGEMLWRDYRALLQVDFPSPKTAGQWRLRSEGWVGFIPVSADLGIELSPKVPLTNLFRMLEVAYQTELRVLPGLVECESLQEFFSKLARVLARRVLDRAARGLHRAYLAERDCLPFVRGNVDLGAHLRRHWVVDLPCEFQEHTADIEDNRILAYTLERIMRSGLCSDEVRPDVRRAYHTLASLMTPEPVAASFCVGRLYDRLNRDYRPMHALCRFFLESTGPTHRAGKYAMLPFLVEMCSLYERFVAEWLRAHLPPHLDLHYQEGFNLGGDRGLDYRIDIVLYDRNGWRPVAVLDAKYKRADRAEQADVNQVVVYASAKGCRDAFLVYPYPLAQPFDAPVGGIRVRSAHFPLEGELDEGGLAFMSQSGLRFANPFQGSKA